MGFDPKGRMCPAGPNKRHSQHINCIKLPLSFNEIASYSVTGRNTYEDTTVKISQTSAMYDTYIRKYYLKIFVCSPIVGSASAVHRSKTREIRRSVLIDPGPTKLPAFVSFPLGNSFE